MSQRSGSEAESGSVPTARIETRDEVRPAPRLALASNSAAQRAAAVPVEHIGALTAAELTELARLSEPELRGVQSGAFSKRFAQSELDWSALRTPTPIPPPPAGESALPSAVQAFYAKLPAQPERAELTIGNLSLDLANPFLGSSLLPPPPKKRPWLKPLSITLGACVLIAAGYAGALWNTDRAGMITALGLANDFPRDAIPASHPTPESSTARGPALPVEAAPATGTVASISNVATEAQPTAAAQPAVVPSAAVDAPAASRPRGRRALRNLRAAGAALPVPPVAAETAPAKPLAPVSTPPSVTATKLEIPAANPVSASVAASATTAPPRATGPVSQELSRAQVQTGLEAVRASLQTCAAGSHGRVLANVTISGAGRVSYASIEGSFAGTPQGSCMARALRAAQFPQFGAPQLRVRYPFAF